MIVKKQDRWLNYKTIIIMWPRFLKNTGICQCLAHQFFASNFSTRHLQNNHDTLRNLVQW